MNNARESTSVDNIELKTVIDTRYSWWCLHYGDRKLWQAIVSKSDDGSEEVGKVWDYGPKDYLVEQCVSQGYGYRVLRYKKNGKIEIREDKSV